MANRKANLISLSALLLAMLGGWGLAMFSANASAGPDVASSQVSPAPAASADVTFEYKILNLPYMSALSLVSPSYGTKGQPRTIKVPFLEDEINKLGAQGYVVESLQRGAVLNTVGDGFGIINTSEFVVLLKRQKK